MEGIDATAFAQAVYDMREAQKHYFSLPNAVRMKEAKGKEERVDQWLKRLVSAGAVKPETKADNKLF